MLRITNKTLGTYRNGLSNQLNSLTEGLVIIVTRVWCAENCFPFLKAVTYFRTFTSYIRWEVRIFPRIVPFALHSMTTMHKNHHEIISNI